MVREISQYKIRIKTATKLRYQKALLSLPVQFKAGSLIESYMNYVADMVEENVKNGKNISFIIENGNLIFIDNSGYQSHIKFDIPKKGELDG